MLRGVRPALGLALSTLALSVPAAHAQTLDFDLYADTSAHVTDAPGPSHAGFSLGMVDFFATARLTDQLRVLSEDGLELGENGAPVFDLERLYIDYQPATWFGFLLGREHIPLGYYSQAFHHALLFQLATDRPHLLRFEDDGGVLPAHFVGLIVHGGAYSSRFGGLRYDLGIGNGRGRFEDDVLGTDDVDDVKAFVARLVVQPEFAPGLELGLSGYIDKIPPGYRDAAGTLLVTESLREQIGAIHLVYRTDPLHLIGEGYYVRHVGRGSGRETTLYGGFGEAGYRIGIWTPYARLELAKRSESDAFYTASQSFERLAEALGGVRVELDEKVVIKLEYARDLVDDVDTGTLQAAFGF